MIDLYFIVMAGMFYTFGTLASVCVIAMCAQAWWQELNHGGRYGRKR